MVEIISRGVLPSEKTYETTCPNCGTWLRLNRGEDKFTSDNRDGDFLTISCPVCNVPVYTQANQPSPPPPSDT
jgi:hypothetical protein